MYEKLTEEVLSRLEGIPMIRKAKEKKYAIRLIKKDKRKVLIAPFVESVRLYYGLWYCSEDLKQEEVPFEELFKNDWEVYVKDIMAYVNGDKIN